MEVTIYDSQETKKTEIYIKYRKYSNYDEYQEYVFDNWYAGKW